MEFSQFEVKIEVLHRVWDTLVLSPVVEEDAGLFYMMFADLFPMVEHLRFDKRVPVKRLLTQFFVDVMSRFEHKITELPRKVLYDLLGEVLRLSAEKGLLSELMFVGESDTFNFTAIKPVKEFVGIEFFRGFLANPRPSELAFDAIQLLSKLYFQAKEVKELSALAQQTLERIDFMIHRGFSSGRLPLLSSGLDTLEFIINTSEMLGGYLYSCYELDRRDQPTHISILVDTHVEELFIYPSAPLRALLRKLYKLAKVPYGQVLFGFASNL